MPNSSGTCKTGERVPQSGRYQCLNCRLLGTDTILDLPADVLLPYCTVCNVKDNTYKLLPKQR
ncbi:MAG TPA: hypothetical protein VFG76_09130 [Candidatus Polarisedimenticolia bacterium]|nr:hypothetical protein [Candidatus Polarisedimenticolia bacterium]